MTLRENRKSGRHSARSVVGRKEPAIEMNYVKKARVFTVCMTVFVFGFFITLCSNLG